MSGLLITAALAAGLITPAAAAGAAQATPATPICSGACKVRVKARVTRERLKETVRPYRDWLRSTRACESGGDYRAVTGNGFYGAYQFTPSSWWAAGGRGMPHEAAPLRQDYIAVRWRQMIGDPHTTAGWPVCG